MSWLAFLRRGGNQSAPSGRDCQHHVPLERPDVLVGILTTKLPKTATSTGCVLMDWQLAGLRAESYFRAYVLTAHRSELTVIGHLSSRDWNQVRICVRAAFAI
jgi:hypothetical protein